MAGTGTFEHPHSDNFACFFVDGDQDNPLPVKRPLFRPFRSIATLTGFETTSRIS
jgi:hypothetical protein